MSKRLHAIAAGACSVAASTAADASAQRFPSLERNVDRLVIACPADEAALCQQVGDAARATSRLPVVLERAQVALDPINFRRHDVVLQIACETNGSARTVQLSLRRHPFVQRLMPVPTRRIAVAAAGDADRSAEPLISTAVDELLAASGSARIAP